MHSENRQLLDLTNPKHQKKTLIIAILFTAISMLAGYFMGLKPIFKARQAKKWVKTDCIVESEEWKTGVEYIEGRPQNVTRLVVWYSYEYGGEKYVSSRYSSTGKTGTLGLGFGGTLRKTRPRGTKAVCYVNPYNPAEAVLSREVSTEGIFWGLVLLSFVVLGTIVTLNVLRRMRLSNN